MDKNIPRISRIKGCLIGGAAGDALGYPVEFRKDSDIRKDFGENGITSYALSKKTGTALVSDDTQMTLFTAQGVLEAMKETGGEVSPAVRKRIAEKYLEWLATQNTAFPGQPPEGSSWLAGVPELYSRRAPGITCLSSLETRSRDGFPEDNDFIASSLNNSCGCGGVMRAAPVGFIPCDDIKLVDMEAAQAAAVTHSHSLGYIPAAILAHIIHRLVFPENAPGTLRGIVEEAMDTAKELFAGDVNIHKQLRFLRVAADLSESRFSDADNIHTLGEGWVGDEALNIAVYCALRYQDDFSAAITAAVNHSGDSDSTGSLCGQIMGAFSGIEGVGEKWLADLELKDTIIKLAEMFE